MKFECFKQKYLKFIHLINEFIVSVLLSVIYIVVLIPLRLFVNRHKHGWIERNVTFNNQGLEKPW